jgi:UV DNA damage endonuclease
MIVRFGYVAMSVKLKNASPSKTMTATRFAQISDRAAAIRKLERIASQNLHNTLRLLRHNQGNGIKVYRFSSRLIPLIGHHLLEGWDPFPALAEDFRAIGDYVIAHGMRVSFHPDHFTVLSSPREQVLRHSHEDLCRHVRMLEAMGLDERAKCNIHVGGTYGDKKAAARRFLSQAERLDSSVRRRLTLENDDKTFNAAETLALCEQTGIPMVLDLHHHQVNNGGEPAEALWPRILRTWEGREIPPKIHVSSPKSERDPRGHADYVEPAPLLAFLRAVASSTIALDVMIEAKMKDEALFQLMRDMEKAGGVIRRNQAEVEIFA